MSKGEKDCRPCAEKDRRILFQLHGAKAELHRILKLGAAASRKKSLFKWPGK